MAADSGEDEPNIRSAAAARRRLLLLRLTVTELRQAWGESPRWQWVATLALAMAGSALIERLAFLDGFEDAIVREVARQRTLAESMVVPGPAELQVQHLEVSAQARVAELEQTTAAPAVVQRLGGVAPIRRDKMADVIDALADRLKAIPTDPNAPPIVAIDVDIAPLEAGETSSEARCRMMNAVDKLRERAHVIAVVLPRAQEDNAGRQDRNSFMVQARCTRLADADTAPPAAACPPAVPASGSEPAQLRARHHALFFASPRLFHATGSYPTRYPYQRKRDEDLDRSWSGIGQLPPYFPSLGTLIQQQHQFRFMHAPGTESPAAAGRPTEAIAARRTLTSLCEEAHAPGPGGELLEDWMDRDRAGKVMAAYKQQRFSWRLLDDPRLQHTPIEQIASLRDPAALDTASLTRPVLLLGIDGGAAYDKFGIAGISSQPISGAGLHALQALSIKNQPHPVLHKLAGVAVDLVVGVVYWAGWALLHPLLIRLRARMPVVGNWTIAAVPLLMGLGLGWGCFWIVAVGMNVDLWINPLYILFGLLMGIYIDAWNESDPGSKRERDYRDRLYGLPRAREALRSGFGSRLEGVHFAASSSYQPITGLDELRVQAETVRSELGSVALADAVLSATLRVLVLVAGWGLIAGEIVTVWRS